jgi:hypothetical protein
VDEISMAFCGSAFIVIWCWRGAATHELTGDLASEFGVWKSIDHFTNTRCEIPEPI